jgi:hypothetical protein
MPNRRSTGGCAGPTLAPVARTHARGASEGISMDLDLVGASTLLAAHAATGRDARRGDRVECLSGSLWITQDGDPRDCVLGPGDAFVADRDGRLIASAMGAGGARFLVLAAGAATAAVA